MKVYRRYRQEFIQSDVQLAKLMERRYINKIDTQSKGTKLPKSVVKRIAKALKTHFDQQSDQTLKVKTEESFTEYEKYMSAFISKNNIWIKLMTVTVFQKSVIVSRSEFDWLFSIFFPIQ